MNKILGLWLLIATFALASCSKEEVMTQSSQVTNHEVTFNFFEKSISEIGSQAKTAWGTRAETSTKLKDSKLATELVVVLFPKGKESDTTYIARQLSTDKDFGELKLYVPTGEYTMVAIAANTSSPSKGNRVIIKATDEVTFPQGIVSDMFYTNMSLTVKDGKDAQSYDCTLKRGVTALVLNCKEARRPEQIKTFSYEISGNCGNVFNPATGYCKNTSKLTRTYDISGDNLKDKHLYFTIYLFLSEDDVSGINLSTKAVDKDGNEMKSNTFDDVRLIKGKKTTYTGPFLNINSSASFNIENGLMEESGYDKDFE